MINKFANFLENLVFQIEIVTLQLIFPMWSSNYMLNFSILGHLKCQNKTIRSSRSLESPPPSSKKARLNNLMSTRV